MLLPQLNRLAWGSGPRLGRAAVDFTLVANRRGGGFSAVRMFACNRSPYRRVEQKHAFTQQPVRSGASGSPLLGQFRWQPDTPLQGQQGGPPLAFSSAHDCTFCFGVPYTTKADVITARVHFTFTATADHVARAILVGAEK
jgi:hypothetical protein